MRRTINRKAEGKHIGHACEGHLRGIVKRALAGTGLSLVREFPFSFHVNPDVIVLDNKGRVHTVIIVAFWNNADNSHMKYYRCRSEYAGVMTAIARQPEHFAKKPVVCVVLYGAPGGWKEQILQDLKTQCSPCFYLPNTFSAKEAAQLVRIAMAEYKPHWESGKSDSREYVEEITASKRRLEPSEQKLLRLIRKLLQKSFAAKAAPPISPTRVKSSIRIPGSPIATRYRQALGFLSLFPNAEIVASQALARSGIPAGSATDYALRAHFLGLGRIIERKAIGRTVLVFEPKSAVRLVAGKSVYAPDLLDFESWREIPQPKLLSILNSHRELTRNPGDVFEGGAFDQCIGNWRDICVEISTNTPAVLHAINAGDNDKLAKALLKSTSVGPEAWHPANRKAKFFPSWALAACAVASSKSDRALRSAFSARTQLRPSEEQANQLAKVLSRTASCAELLAHAVTFCSVMLSCDIRSVANTATPEVISPDNPCSLLKDFYNTLTTNSSHNPLNCPVHDWLLAKYSDFLWHGWPNRRSVGIAKLLKKGGGRRQWQFAGIDPKSRTVVAAEVKSITANHWGDKSKEIYDRVAETRATASAAGYDLVCIGVFDGDVGNAEFRELETGIGYDQVYSIKEVLGIP